MLGDSFTEAQQVPGERSFSELLEVGLSRAGPAEVINAGISGFGTDNALLFFEHEAYKYVPDLVVLAFCVCNDVRSNWYRLEKAPEASESHIAP